MGPREELQAWTLLGTSKAERTAGTSHRGHGNLDWMCNIRVVGGLGVGILMEYGDKEDSAID